MNRRNLIKTAALAVAALVVPSVASPEPFRNGQLSGEFPETLLEGGITVRSFHKHAFLEVENGVVRKAWCCCFTGVLFTGKPEKRRFNLTHS